MSEHAEHFEGVVYPEATGIIDGGRFRFAEKIHEIYSDATFTLMELPGARIAVFFVEEPLSESRRSDIKNAKPDWVDTIVFAEVDPSSNARCAVIDAQVDSPGESRPTAVGFAAALVIVGHGAFTFVPESYLVRLSDELAVNVLIKIDSQTELWSGDAALVASE